MLRREAAAAQMATANGNTREPSQSVELSALEGGEGPQLMQQQQMDVSQAEADLHSAIVDEYTNEIGTMANDIAALQRAMGDIREHASAQGVTLTSIEGEMETTAQTTGGATEQLTQASRHHRTGTKMLYWLLLLAAVIAGALIVIVVLNTCNGFATAPAAANAVDVVASFSKSPLPRV